MGKLCNVALIFCSCFIFAFPLNSRQAFASENEKKCVAFGDSITTGYRLGFKNSYANMFAEENGYELINYAKDGLTSDGLLDQLDKVEKDNIIRSEVVILCIGANDLLNLLSKEVKSSPSIDEINALGITLLSTEFSASLTEALNNFKTNYTKIIDCFKQYNESIYALNVYNPYMGIILENQIYGLNHLNLGLTSRGWLEKLNKIIAEVNNEKNVYTVDIFSAYNDYSGIEKLTNAYADIFYLNFEFDPHPTLAGQKLIFETLQKEFEKDDSINTFKWWWIAVAVGSTSILFFIIYVLRKKRVL